MAGTAESILEAAMAVYGRGGASGFSMRGVASEVGITATAIYRHFADKAALDRALLERARGLLGSYLRDGLAGDDPIERLWSCADSYVRFVVDYPQLYRLLFLDPLAVRPDLDEMQTGEDAAPFRFMIELIREAMDSRLLAAGDPGTAALSVWAHIHGICSLALAGRIAPGQLRAVCRASLADLYEGLRERRESDG